jgi:hypothetical protein
MSTDILLLATIFLRLKKRPIAIKTLILLGFYDNSAI